MRKPISECCGAEIYDDAIQAEIAREDGTVEVDIICVPFCPKCHKACKVIEKEEEK